MKEFFNPDIEKQLLKQLIGKLNEINQHWENIDSSSGVIGENAESNGMDEGEVRNLEKVIVKELVSINFKKEDLTKEDLAILERYLSVGDNEELKKQIAQKIGIEYKGLFDRDGDFDSFELGASQILKEIEKEKKKN